MFFQAKIDNEFKPKEVILIAALNWGLGHATRCIPIIDFLIQKGHTVVVASDGIASKILTQTFPNLTHHILPSYDIKYHKYFTFGLVIQIPKLVIRFFQEKNATNTLVSQHKITTIISDNRFGVYHPSVQNIYISHQLTIPHSFKLFSRIATLMHELVMKKYNTVWVPDFDDHLLTGKLTINPNVKNIRFIGPLSRFTPCKFPTAPNNNIVIILSGPEPQRSILENKLISQLSSMESITLIRGTISNKITDSTLPQSWRVVDMASSEQLQECICQASYIITRAGYTSIMDFYTLQKPVIMIPTPNQPEQEYLGKWLEKTMPFTIVTENNLAILPKLLLANG